MQLREFAHSVLFANTMAEKLAPPPPGLSDSKPGPAIASPDAPGRPEALRLRSRGAGHTISPRAHELADDADRGRLLHFFANHELLATELMALVLLRFPDAPAAFRQSVLHTLKEEQRHTKLYLQRMAACGVTFGDLPVSGFFWNSVAPMETPSDYVSRLSLTFEQANLDYARHFARVFARSNDPSSAAVLERIYHDEISHVRAGLHWFRKWKNPADSDWDAFRKRLHFPLSPVRAKGSGPFNAEGRRAAGLDDHFISQLRLFSQSRGRTPDVYYFNPDAETAALAAARGTAYSPSRASQSLQEDLATLPIAIARKDDIVAVPQLPSAAFLQHLHDAAIPLPELVETASLRSITPARRLHSLRPWAATPDAASALAPLHGQLSSPPTTVAPHLFSKATGASLARDVLEAASPALAPFLPHPHELAVVVTDPNKLPNLRPLLLRAPFSTAGRGRLALHGPDHDDARKTEEWVRKTVAAQGAVVAAPWLDRVFDFSVQYELAPSGRLVRKGFVHLTNSTAGQFQSCAAPQRFTDGLPPEVRRHLFHPPHGLPGGGWFATFFSDIMEPLLAARLGEAGFHGPFGIDAFFYHDHAGALRLHPLVELNPRFTMGRVAVELRRHTAQGCAPRLTIINQAQARAAGPHETFTSWAKAKAAADPPVVVAGRLAGGTVCLSDPTLARRFLATCSVYRPR